MDTYCTGSALPIGLTFAGASEPLVCATAGDQAAAAPAMGSMTVTGCRADIIPVNAVCRGPVETGTRQGLYDARAKGRQAVIGQPNPLRRGDEPGEIANAIVTKE